MILDRDASAQWTLLAVAVGAAWLPVETRPFTAAAVALVILCLCPWGWRNSSLGTSGALGGAAVFLVGLGCSAISGWDPASAVGEIGLVATVMALVWLASRTRPPDVLPTLLAVGLAGLAVWGLWQAVAGLEALGPGIEELATPGQAYAAERVASRRAFASLPVPGHLAALLATALPLLITRAGRSKAGLFSIGTAVLAVAGLAATRSPIGLGLAMVAVVPILAARHRKLLPLAAGGLLVALVAVIVARPDVAAFEPLALRIDNWQTGGWLWTTSPAAGVGMASFAQASQANPLAVGNRPAHAHSLLAEGLAELGPAGLVGVLVLAVGLAWLARSLWSEHRAVAMAILIVPLHNLVDFSFFVTGVALPWAVLLGWAVAYRREDSDPSPAPPTFARTAIVLAAAVALGLTVLHATSIIVEEAAAAGSRPAEVFDGALRAAQMAPWRVEPQFLLASAAIASGERPQQDDAWRELDRRRWMRPRSAALAERRARLALARGDVSTALAELWVASTYGSPDRASAVEFDAVVSEVTGDPHGPPR